MKINELPKEYQNIAIENIIYELNDIEKENGSSYEYTYKKDKELIDKILNERDYDLIFNELYKKNELVIL